MAATGHVLLAAALGLAALGAQSPALGPEQTVAPQILTAERFEVDALATVAGPGGFLVTWQAAPYSVNSAHIRATLLDPDGQPLDPVGVTLGEWSGSPYPWLKATGGTNEYLVVWQETDGNTPAETLRGALLAPPGSGNNPILSRSLISQIGQLVGPPALAFDAAPGHPTSGRYLLLYANADGVWARWMSPTPDGLSDPPDTDFMIIDGSTPVSAPRLAAACSTGGCLVAWEGLWYDTSTQALQTALFTRAVSGLDQAGLGPTQMVLPFEPEELGDLALSADGDGYLLSYAIDAGVPSVNVLQLDAAGAPLDPTPLVVTSDPTARFPLLARTGPGEHLLAWLSNHATVTLTTLDTQPAPPTSGQETDLSWLGSSSQTVGLACTDAPTRCVLTGPFNTGALTLQGALVDPDLGSAPDAPHTLATRPSAQRVPDLACGRGGACLVTWQEAEGFSKNPFMTAVIDAQPTADEPLAIRVEAPVRIGQGLPDSRPTVAAASLEPGARQRFLAAWRGQYDQVDSFQQGILAMVLDASGSRVPITLAPPVDEPSPFTDPAAAASRDHFMVAWGESQGVDENALHVARIGARGDLAGGQPEVLSIDDDTLLGGYPPVITHDGEAFLLVWPTHDAHLFHLTGWRVTATGPRPTAVGEPFVAAGSLQTMRAGSYALASEGNGVSLLIWEDTFYGPGDVDYELRAVRLGPTGFPLGDSVRVTSGVSVHHPRVTFDGEVYLVSWQRRRGDNEESWGTWIGRDGSVFPEGGFPLSADVRTDEAPSPTRAAVVSSPGEGLTLLATTQSRFEEPGGGGYVDPARVRAKLLGNPCQRASAPVTCAGSACVEAGWCHPLTETCEAQVPRPDGTVCEGGLCVAGTCVPSPESTPPAEPPPAPLDVGDDPAAAGCGCHAVSSGSSGLPGLPALLGLLALLGCRVSRRRAARA
ncbi:hypothetical protein [Chondromyces apiculatus]|uniref:Uncharacterized protein n=1 Tax=Chondromyces apiculatus DSM 436 TaxID=1192034 RepID=A0A017SYL3_9BACT|nr:hypothetical protein [Chondromyces apiculatus]EYF01401.1 Hypothetical protein CAP_8332 [Chondromyces apiculatus DSM 436]